MKAKYQIGALKTKVINEVNITNKSTKNVETSNFEKLSLMTPSATRHSLVDIIAMYGNDLQRDLFIPFLVTLSLIRAF